MITPETITKILTPDECSSLINEIKSNYILKEGGVVGKQKMNKTTKFRKASITFVPELPKISKILEKIILEKVQQIGCEIPKFNPYQFTEYKQNEFYNWHTDTDDKTYRNRHISIVIELNNGYCGGNLEIIDSNNNLIKCENEIGNLHIFPSYLRHRVTEVTDGTRYSLVNWITLGKVKNKENVCLI